MPYEPPVMVHVAAGAVGIVSGFAALAVRKGERPHRVAGTVFLVSMLTMAGFAAVLSILATQRGNAMGAVFTMYLVATAWVAARRPEGTVGRFEAAGLFVAVGVMAAGLAFGLQAASPAGLRDGDPSSGNAPDIYFAFATLSGLAAAMDLRVIRRRGLIGADRISRHLWRMCLALFVAAGSFFFGQADEIPAALRGAHLSIPPFAALAALVFWMIRVRLPQARRARAKPA